MFDAGFGMAVGQLRVATTSSGGVAVTNAPAAEVVVSTAPAEVSMAPVGGPATTAAAGSAATEPVKGTPQSPLPTILMIGAMLAVLYIVMFRGQKKTEKSRKAMIEQMKKGDRVMTVGGLVARVVSIDEDEVVLKIDESANVKATYKKSSIQQVLDRDEKTKS